ncbi:4-hydroxy-3-methylbut-2-enyl diphosphate reductase [Chloroflexota bacterium]
MKVTKAEKTGFCFGVRRAVSILEDLARERGSVETLGAVVHNEQVLEKLVAKGVTAARDVADIKGKIVVTSSHGISPAVEAQLRTRGIAIVSTTCPFVRRAQMVARRLVESGFFVVVFGDVNHPEVKGILGWVEGKGVATMNATDLAMTEPLPRRVGVLSQTTQIPAEFIRFGKEVIDITLKKDTEIRIIDTICHDIRERQTTALKLAKKVDLMLVIGGSKSANTRHLAELCASATETHRVATEAEIDPSWLEENNSIGVTGSASTDEETVARVLKWLRKTRSPGR